MTNYEKWSKFETSDEEKENHGANHDCSDILDEIPKEVPSKLSLCLAAKEKKFYLLDELLSSTADPNDQDPHGRTPLLLVLTEPYFPAEARPFVERLLSAGASVNIAAQSGETPLSRAACIGHEELMDAFLQGPLNTRALGHALFWAAKSAMPIMARRLSAKNASPWHYRDDGNLSCLHYWSAQGDLALMNMAILHDGFETIDCATNGGITPLHVAIRHADLETCTTPIQLLIDAKADTNTEAMNGETPLNMCRSLEATKLLVSHGADVNYVPRLHKTALVSAIECQGEGQAEFLLKEGKADPNIGGLSPLVSAIRVENLAHVQLVIEAKALVNKEEEVSGSLPLIVAAALGHAPIVEALLSSGADANLRDHTGFSALHRTECTDVARLLLQTVAVDTVAEGKTALVLAAGSGNVEMCRLLLEHKANINTIAPCTPLIAASANGQEDTCRLLLECGANKDIAVNGLTAAQIAEKNDFSGVVELLSF